jgi:hypothetical protein
VGGYRQARKGSDNVTKWLKLRSVLGTHEGLKLRSKGARSCGECQALPSAPGGRFGVRAYGELATGEGYTAEAATNAALRAAAAAGPVAAAALPDGPFCDSGERGEAMLADGIGAKSRSFAFPAGAEDKVENGQRECPNTNNTCRLYTRVAMRC